MLTLFAETYIYLTKIHKKNPFFFSFSIYSHKKAINVYMLTCSEAVPQRYSHETGAPKKKKDPLRRTDLKCFTTDITIM